MCNVKRVRKQLFAAKVEYTSMGLFQDSPKEDAILGAPCSFVGKAILHSMENSSTLLWIRQSICPQMYYGVWGSK